MTITKATIQKELGTYIRDKLRLDDAILAFNSTVAAKNWIFLGRPKDMEKTFDVPRIIIEEIDEIREPYSLDELDDVFIPYTIHAWLDQAVAGSYDKYELSVAIKNLAEGLEGSENIYKSEIGGCSKIPEPYEHKVLIHIIVQVNIIWRE